MKKRLISLALVLMMLTSFASAAVNQVDRASDYLMSYAVSIDAIGDDTIEIYYEVDGKGWMDKIGIQAIYIEEYVNSSWQPYDTLLGSQNPDFYSYDALGHSGFAYFEGTPGVDYRVTLQVYTKGYDGGSDTGTVTSWGETCR